jgi:hypothetical protein
LYDKKKFLDFCDGKKNDFCFSSYFKNAKNKKRKQDQEKKLEN